MVFDSGTPLLEICSGETSRHVSKNQCTWMFATSCLLQQTLPNYKCPSTEGCLDKSWYIHVMEYYTAIKKEELGITSPNIHCRVNQYREAERQFGNICHNYKPSHKCAQQKGELNKLCNAI